MAVDGSANDVRGGDSKQTWWALEAAADVHCLNSCHAILAVGNQGISHHFTIQQGKGELPAVKDTKEITAVVVQCRDFKQTVLGQVFSRREHLGGAEAV